VSITIRALTTEEKVDGLIDLSWTVVVAIDDVSGAPVSYYAFDTSCRDDPCPGCKMRCARSRMLWCLMERRGEGIFRDIWDWTRAEYGLDRFYSTGFGPRGDAEVIWWRYAELADPPADYQNISWAESEQLAKQFMSQVEKAVSHGTAQ
jgi:hypothetical protein